MYHIVYLTTNQVNRKIYVGVHSTHNLDDGYLGSGDKLKLAFKKHGKQNFTRQILHYCLTEDQSLEYEAMIVDQSFVDRNDTYNIKLGGGNKVKFTQSTKDKISKATMEQIKFGNFNPGNRKGVKLTAEHKIKISTSSKGLKRSKETKSNIRKSKIGVERPQWYKDKMSKHYKLVSPTSDVYIIKSNDKLIEFSNIHMLSFNNLLKFIDLGKIYIVHHPKLYKKSTILRIANTNGWEISVISK